MAAKLTREEVLALPDADKLRLIAAVASRADADETAGDWTKRAQTIRWIASNGTEGESWGHWYVAREVWPGRWED